MGGFLLGAYREQLLKETYGQGRSQIYGQMKTNEEDNTAKPFALFKIRFMVCLFLFAGFSWLSLTESSFCNITSEQIITAVTEEDLSIQLSKLGLYE